MPRFSVYRLKGRAGLEAYIDTESEASIYRRSLDEGEALLAVEVRPDQPPSWAAWLRAEFQRAVFESVPTQGAALLLEADGYIFAITFGHIGRYIIDRNAIEAEFGRRVALNLMEPAELKRLATSRYADVTVRHRATTSRSSPVRAFDIDKRRDVVSGASGRPRDQETWGNDIYGADAFVFTTQDDVELEQVPSLLQTLNEAHASDEYKKHFAWIDYVATVRDEELLEQLELFIVKSLLDNPHAFDLDPPAPEPDDELQYAYPYEQTLSTPEISTKGLFASLKKHNRIEEVTAESLKRWRIRHLGGDRETVGSWPIWSLLTGAFEYDGKNYVLDEGRVLLFDADFLATVNAHVSSLQPTRYALPSLHPKLSEECYLKQVGADSSEDLLVMDRKLITVAGDTPVELCDLFTKEGGLLHIKRHWRSSSLTHLAAQGRVSADLLLRQAGFRQAAAERVDQIAGDVGFRLAVDSYSASGREVGYVIIGPLGGRNVADRIPVLARVHLSAVIQDLQAVGYEVTLTAVEPAIP